MKKILFVGWSPLNHTSYGNIIRELSIRLSKDYEVYCLVTGMLDIDKWQYKAEQFKFKTIVSPKINKEDAQDGLDTFSMLVGKDIPEPDVVILVDDAYNMGRWANSIRRTSFKLLMYAPIDGYPYPKEYIDILAKADGLITYTDLSKDYLENIYNVKSIAVIPAGVDTEIFKPYPEDVVAEYRKTLGSDDALNLLFIGMNQPRKQNWQLIEMIARVTNGHYYMCEKCKYVLKAHEVEYDEEYAFRVKKEGYYLEKPLLETCKCGGKIVNGDKLNINLWMHTNPIMNVLPNGEVNSWNLERYANLLDVKDRAKRTPLKDGIFYVSPEELSTLINLHDLILQITGGEGFGMPALEAVLCGKPVLYTNYSAHTHFLKGYGFPVKISAFEHRMRNSVRRGLVDMFDLVSNLVEIYYNRNLLKEKQKEIMTNLENLQTMYSWDTIANQWKNTIEKVLSIKKELSAVWC